MKSRYALIGLVAALAACKHEAAREPQSEKLPKNSLDLSKGSDDRVNMIPLAAQKVRESLGSTAPKEYVFPLQEALPKTEKTPKGSVGSAWCECRGIGTSPHIGQDYIQVPGKIKSVAVSNGLVVGVGYDRECGTTVEVVDGNEVLWRYLHINDKALVKIGDLVKRGQAIGVHGQYPKPDGKCGSGPHLHLERRWDGSLPPKGFARRSKGNACPRQTTIECYADPLTPLKDQPVIGSIAKVVPVPRKDPRPSCDMTQPSPQSVKEAPVPGGRIPAYVNSFLSEIKVKIQLTSAQDDRLLIHIPKFALINNDGVNESKNICGVEADNPKDSCVVRWELQAKTDAGDWKSVIVEQNTRNQPLFFKANYCWPADAVKAPWKYRLIATTETGRKLVTEGEIPAITR